MSYTVLYTVWGALFALSAGLGFIPAPEGAAKLAMQILAVLFFVPGWLILHRASKENNRHHRAVVRNLCLASIGLTILLMVLGVMSANWSEAVGNALHAVLTIVSAPMVCGQSYFLGLFLWGCLLMGAVGKSKK